MNYSVKASRIAMAIEGRTTTMKTRSKNVIFTSFLLVYKRGTVNYSPFTFGSGGNLLVPHKPTEEGAKPKSAMQKPCQKHPAQSEGLTWFSQA